MLAPPLQSFSIFKNHIQTQLIVTIKREFFIISSLYLRYKIVVIRATLNIILLIPKEPNTSTTAPMAIATVKNRPDLKMDYNAKLSPKYIKNRNIHQYMRTSVILLRDRNLNKSKKLYSLLFFAYYRILSTNKFRI